jgi:hypothetical protein
MSKAVWGPATWSLLHCLVIKINDVKNLESLKNLITNICSNLPCPYCTSHATAILKQSKFGQFNNILALRTFMWQFHNKVNERLKKKTMEYSEHLEKYNNMKLVDVINLFIKVYSQNSGITMMLYNFHKKQLITQLRGYFNENAYLYVLN